MAEILYIDRWLLASNDENFRRRVAIALANTAPNIFNAAAADLLTGNNQARATLASAVMADPEAFVSRFALMAVSLGDGLESTVTDAALQTLINNNWDAQAGLTP
jgi:hypothetical protein